MTYESTVLPGAPLWTHGQPGEGCEVGGPLRGQDAVTQRRRGHRGADGRAVGGHEDRLGEVEEEVEDPLVPLRDHGVQLPRVHGLDVLAEVGPRTVVGIRARQYHHLQHTGAISSHVNNEQ